MPITTTATVTSLSELLKQVYPKDSIITYTAKVLSHANIYYSRLPYMLEDEPRPSANSCEPEFNEYGEVCP